MVNRSSGRLRSYRLFRSIDVVVLNVPLVSSRLILVKAPWTRWFASSAYVSLPSYRRDLSVNTYGMFVITSCRLMEFVCIRPAVKNHTRSLISGPPIVYSCVGTTSSSFVSLAKGSLGRLGTSARQSSLVIVSRNEPLNWLPPDLLTMLTTPPPKRPNSADTPAVATVVSWMASSITRSCA